jgi:hypothetical protein
MAKIGLLVFGSLGFAVGAQTLDSREASRQQRLVAIVVMAIFYLIANLGALAILDV